MSTPARRSGTRARSACPATITTSALTVKTVTIDVSARSALLDHPLTGVELGTLVTLTLGNPPAVVSFDATVVRNDATTAVVAWPTPALPTLAALRDLIETHRQRAR